MFKEFRIPFVWITIIILMVISSSCTEEVEINASGSSVNIVYCLLNPDEDIQYVRVGRSYNGDSESYSVSPHPDSLVWKEKYSVYIEEWGENQKINEIFHFSPSSGFEKDTGFFPVDGLAIFEAPFNPKPLHTYSLYVHFENDDKISNGIATVPADLIVHDPKPIPNRKINLQSGLSYTIRWEPAEYAGVYQTFFKVIYREQTATGVEFNSIDFNSQIFTEFSSTSLVEKTISGNRFFEECLNQVDSTKDAIREVVNVSFEMLIGGEEYGLYLFSQVNGNYLSSAFSEYSNVTNGIGIFSSLSKYQINNLQLSNTTLDELAYGEKTRSLGFLDHYGKR